MNRFGVQCEDNLMKKTLINDNCKSLDEHKNIREVLKKFQHGYTEKNIEKINDFMDELFINKDNIGILGTGTEELALGVDEVKELIKGDWLYWGDVDIDYENAHINCDEGVAWFSVKGSVKHNFEDTKERYENYVDFVKSKVEDTELTDKEKVAFINWVLALTYHQRKSEKREYLWPMCLSGVMLDENKTWKICNLQFSISKANFPDERFESSNEYIDSYKKQNIISKEYKNNQLTLDIKNFISNFQNEFLNENQISTQLVNKYFKKESNPYIIGPESKWHYGSENIMKFFNESDNVTWDLDTEYGIVLKSGKMAWVTFWGTVKQCISEEEVAKRSLEEIKTLFNHNLTPEEKLFKIQRSVAYGLKECAVGEKYTNPIRITAVIEKDNEGYKFNTIHLSFPFSWIFEGKLDSIQ